MLINLTPQLRADALALSVSGDALEVNGTVYDFAALIEGATLPIDAVGCDWLASDVTRLDGEIVLTLILPHGPAAPMAARFPSPIATADGPVTLPGA